VKHLIPYNGPAFKKFADLKVSVIRHLGSLLGVKIVTPNCPPFRRYRGQILKFDPYFSNSSRQIVPKI